MPTAPRMVKRLAAAGAVALVAATGSPAHADKCTGAKLKAIGKKESALVGCHAKVSAKGDPNLLASCVAKVEGKYATAFGKAGSCSGDQSVCECFAETCAAFIRADLPDAGPSKCEAARLKAAGKTASGKLACNAKAAAKGVAVDPACLQKVEAKYQAAFAKATGCTGDPNGVELTVDSTCVTAVGGDPVGGGTVGTICASSCTAVTTTTTTISGGTTTTTALTACPPFASSAYQSSVCHVTFGADICIALQYLAVDEAGVQAFCSAAETFFLNSSSADCNPVFVSLGGSCPNGSAAGCCNWALSAPAPFTCASFYSCGTDPLNLTCGNNGGVWTDLGGPGCIL